MCAGRKCAFYHHIFGFEGCAEYLSGLARAVVEGCACGGCCLGPPQPPPAPPPPLPPPLPLPPLPSPPPPASSITEQAVMSQASGRLAVLDSSLSPPPRARAPIQAPMQAPPPTGTLPPGASSAPALALEGLGWSSPTLQSSERTAATVSGLHDTFHNEQLLRVCGMLALALGCAVFVARRWRSRCVVSGFRRNGDKPPPSTSGKAGRRSSGRSRKARGGKPEAKFERVHAADDADELHELDVFDVPLAAQRGVAEEEPAVQSPPTKRLTQPVLPAAPVYTNVYGSATADDDDESESARQQVQYGKPPQSTIIAV